MIDNTYISRNIIYASTHIIVDSGSHDTVNNSTMLQTLITMQHWNAPHSYYCFVSKCSDFVSTSQSYINLGFIFSEGDDRVTGSREQGGLRWEQGGGEQGAWGRWKQGIFSGREMGARGGMGDSYYAFNTMVSLDYMYTTCLYTCFLLAQILHPFLARDCWENRSR